MDEFCGDVKNAWGISAKGYFTHCFDDLILFGSTYVFIFVVGSYRAWTLLHTPTKEEFPYSTRHSVKVMVLGWLGIFPMIIFAAKYSNGVHDDFEWVAKPLASLAWLYSLWILNMEVARDLRECWVLKMFWSSSVVAATVAMPTVVLAAEANGYGVTFYAYILHYILYLAIALIAFRFPHLSQQDVPEWKEVAQGQHKTGQPSSSADAPPFISFLSGEWVERLGRLLSLFAPERLLLAAAFICLCAALPLSALAVVVIGRMFNNFYYPYAPDSARGHLREYCLIIVIIYALSAALQSAYSTLVHIAGERMASRTRRKLLQNLLRQEASFFDSHSPERLGGCMKQDVAVVQKTLCDLLFHAVHCMLNVLVALSIMLFISWKMSLVVLSLAPICVLVMGVQSFYARRMGKERSGRLAEASALLRETLSHLRVLKSFAAEDVQLDKYKERVADVYEVSLQSGLVDATSKSSATLMVQFSVALSLYVGGVAVLSRQVEVGYLIAFAILSILAVSSMAQLPPLLRQVSKALAATTNLFSLLDRIPNLPASGAQVIESLEGRVELAGVSFSYSPDQGPVLSDLTLTIPSGSFFGIVGARGSGKSTLVTLMQRLHQPETGSIAMDGVDYRGLDADWLREKISVVQQEPVLFGTSIAANIAYPSETATQAQVEAATRFADAHSFILSLPDGYQAVLGETGVRLTAAQKLQVALARALIADGKLLILDETLSNLHPHTANVVLGNLERERGSRTVIALTAFPESLGTSPHRIALLDAGKVVEEGSPAELLQARGRYYQLAQGGADRKSVV